MIKRGIKVFGIVIVIIILGGAILLYLFGKPANVNTDTELDGVSDEMRSILYYGSLAANSHNSQSWIVQLDLQAQKLLISLDEDRILGVVDPKCRELYISIGCYIESLAHAFGAYGYKTNIEYVDFSGINGEIAAISYYRPDNANINDQQIETIERRHTDKRAYKTDRIDSEVITHLLDGMSGIYYYEIDTENFEYLKTGTMEAITEQSAEMDYRAELNQWLRFSNKEVEQKKDGISAEMMGLNGIVKALYYLTTNHKNAEGDTFATQSIDTAKKQTDNCSAFFVITGNDTIIDWIEVGRKTQAFWYRCVENNISIQPLSAMLELAPYSEEIQNVLGVTENVQMILRAGYVDDYGENVGVRRNLKDYITVIDGN